MADMDTTKCEHVVHNTSELIVPARPGTIEPMVQDNENHSRRAFAARLASALTQAGYPDWGRAKRLADEMGLSAKAIGKWLNAETMPETKRIEALAALLHVNGEWLLTGKGEQSPAASAIGTVKEEAKGYLFNAMVLREIPILSWERACHGQLIDIEPEEYQGTAYAPATSAPGTFALTVLDDDMDSVYAPYRIPRGCRLIIDPSETDPEALLGKLVVAGRDDGTCCLRELNKQAGELVLKSWGERVLRPVMPFAEGWRVIGVLDKAEIILYQK